MPLLLAVATRDARRRRLGDLRPQDLRQPQRRCGPRRVPRDGHVGPRRTRRSSTDSCPADANGIQIIDTWDTLGMRATQSQDTVLDKAFVPDDRCRWCARPGSRAPARSTSSIFAWALMGFAAMLPRVPPSAPFDMTIDDDADSERRSR